MTTPRQMSLYVGYIILVLIVAFTAWGTDRQLDRNRDTACVLGNSLITIAEAEVTTSSEISEAEIAALMSAIDAVEDVCGPLEEFPF